MSFQALAPIALDINDSEQANIGTCVEARKFVLRS